MPGTDVLRLLLPGFIARWFVASSPAVDPAPATESSHDLLSEPLVWLTERDCLTGGDCTEGVHIFGAVGSGKTSGSGQLFALSFLRASLGGLVLCAKADECTLWQRYAAATGRTDDLIIVSLGGPHTFNFLDYEIRSSPHRSVAIENVVRLFIKAGEITRPSTSGSNEAFWQNALEELLRNAIALIVLAEETLTLAAIQSVITSAPQDILDCSGLGEHKARSDYWWATSHCGRLITRATECVEASGSEDDAGDLEQTKDYWFRTFVNLDGKPRSSIIASFTGMASGLLRGQVRKLFTGRSTVTPEDSFRGKIIILDIPEATFHETGVFLQVVFKLCWQRAAGKRTGDSFPAFLWADEAHKFLSLDDQVFFTTARAARVLPVFLTQSVENYKAALGKPDMVSALLINFATKVFHCSGSPEMNKWAAEIITEGWAHSYSLNQGGSHDARGASLSHGGSISEQRRYAVEPREFTYLAKGGPDFGYIVEGYIFRPSKLWSETGANFALIAFDQRAPALPTSRASRPDHHG